MIRIIDGVAYSGTAGKFYKVKAYPLGNGHLEVTGFRVTEWKELDWSPSVLRDHMEMLERYREEHADEIAQRHLKQAATRAKSRVRRLCKAMGVDTLLTLTYRANQTDLALCKKHLKEFNRRMLRVLPGFACVAAFERQERGAWHVHMACKRIPRALKDRNAVNAQRVKSYDLIRAVWRSVTGELGGNIDVKRRKYHADKSPAQIASYIAGYIIKQFAEGEKWSNRWTKFGEVDVPEPVVMGHVASALEMLDVVFSLCSEARNIARMRLDKWQDRFFIAAEGVPAYPPPVKVDRVHA